MIHLAFSTNAFKKHTLDEAITAIAQAGYGGVELMADVPHCYPATFSTADRLRLRDRLDELDLMVSNINAFTLFAQGDTYHPTWIEDDAALRQARIEHTIAAIELAAEFEAGTVSLQPGGPLIGTTLTRAAASERFAEGLNQVLPSARKHQIVLAIEPEPGLLIQTSEEYLAFKNQFFAKEDAIRMNCDLGHLFCVGEDPAGVMVRMPEQIAHIHLEDIDSNRVHQHLAPGSGAMDFRSIFRSLNDVGYKGWVTVELYPYETTAAAVTKTAHAFLKRLI
ncbi:MAG TPA: sugar phosphate isomerase/epimerase [Tepidisphaeraceae bacterium]|nr:sugar phosphate isomerase/epimerase [Tepidisphaeraceae bacterium]